MKFFSPELIIFVLAFAWDQIFGEYPNALHPVVWMGKCVSVWEKTILGRGPTFELMGGICLAIILPAIFAAGAYLALKMVSNPFLLVLAGVFIFKASFALQALLAASDNLGTILKERDLAKARYELRDLCSRDANDFTEEQLIEATISSLAENLCDSVVAPFFYYCVGGIPLALAYRAINTMDAMIGYKNQYFYFGKAVARLDDLANWIPARVTALGLWIAGGLSGGDWRLGWTVAWRDHALTPSPNGGWPMAMQAGLLGVQLVKPDTYALGERTRACDLKVLQEARRMVQRGGWLSAALSILYVGFKG